MAMTKKLVSLLSGQNDAGKFRNPNRRAFIGGLAASVGGASLSSSAFAQTEWGESFDAQTPNVQAVQTNRPVLNPQAATEVEWALQQYSGIMARGGWNAVPADATLKLGMSHPNVAALRQRLITTGDLQQSSGLSNSFDSYVSNRCTFDSSK